MQLANIYDPYVFSYLTFETGTYIELMSDNVVTSYIGLFYKEGGRFVVVFSVRTCKTQPKVVYKSKM